MEKKEYKIGETFQCGLANLKCVSQEAGTGCNNCFFIRCCTPLGMDCIDKIVGNCAAFERTDKTNVVFIEVKD